MEPDKAVLTSAIVTLGSTAAGTMLPKDLGGRGELPTARMLIGTSISFLGLSILADIAPGVAVPLSACIAITALTYFGIPLIEGYFTDKPTTKGSKTP